MMGQWKRFPPRSLWRRSLVLAVIPLLQVCGVLSSLLVPEEAPGEAPIRIITIENISNGWTYRIAGEAIASGDLVTKIEEGYIRSAQQVEIRFGAGCRIDSSFAPPYTRIGLIPALAAAGARTSYFDAEGNRLDYHIFTWTGYVSAEDDPEKAICTLDGKPCSRSTLVDLLRLGEFKPNACIQIVTPWPKKLSEPEPDYPFDVSGCLGMMRSMKVRAEFIYQRLPAD